MARRPPPGLPPRPAVPPVLAFGLGLWASCAAAYSAARGWGVGACLAVGAAALAAAVVASVLLLRRGGRVLAWCALLGALAGAACGCAGGASLLVAWQEAAGEPSGLLRFEAMEDADAGLYGAQCVGRTRLSGGRAVDVRLRFADGAAVPRYGDVFEADVSLAAPDERAADWCWQRGIAATATVRHAVPAERSDALGMLLGMRARAVEVIAGTGGEGAAVLRALVCGDRTALDGTDVYDSFKTAGLAHLVAVSGAHLVLVCAFAGAAFKALRAPRALAVAAQAALLLCYLALSAAPVSAVRAALMTFAGMSSFFARRRPASLNAVGLCAAGVVATSPVTALSASFALSVLSTLGIVLFAGLAAAWIGRLAPRLPRFAAEAVGLTVASSVLAQPLSAALFSQVPLVAPLANVAAAPLFPLACAGGLAATVAALAVPPAGPPLLAAAAFAAEGLCSVARLCAGLPHASVPVDVPVVPALACAAVLAALLWAVWPAPNPRAAALVAGAALAAALAGAVVVPRLAGDEIIMLDVGQGDAFVVRSEGAAVLVDTGNQDRLLREALARHAVYRLDAVVVTHGDDDHMGSLASLKGVVQVERVLLAGDALSCPCEACANLRSDAAVLVGDEGVLGLAQGDELRVGAFSLDVVWPRAFVDEGGNADSVCLLARADPDGDGTPDWTALFTGDAEHEQLAAMEEQGLVGRVDILKVGHHGSKNALTPELAAALSPRIALVSAGAGNRYGHPADKTLQELADAGAQVRRTDEEGDVSCKLSAQGIVVKALG
ncbi:DNA internalization-related competence protein ComEC/Rec2 [Gordonibacter sp. 28C]|uniref:ComEC/Rec2 family competence protein n=1 Tax=Gordonibacter sp. 28C TaxID=2078569 RepID=UPI000DF7C731|nr:ComEC/Rec2 family competence protein [Gordonibacter sp. 28C]RDB62319.1 DNA internalization-related competence protein ComEC/Rec2 [Gordonibacter sp. 28C]